MSTGRRVNRDLLFETLSWLDNLPLKSFEPAGNEQSRSISAIAKLSKRHVTFEDTSHHSIKPIYNYYSEYEDNRDDWCDVLMQKRSYLQYGWKRWRNYTVTHAHRYIIHSNAETVATDPSWRVFLLLVRALQR
jgi:hypothetical protein